MSYNEAMADPKKIYRKHQSFVGLRGKAGTGADAVPARLKALDASWPQDGDARVKVVREALDELHGRLRPPAGQEAFALHDNSAAEMARLADADLPRYLHYRFRYEAFPARRRLDEWPPLVQIEPASSCNFRCVFCYQTDSDFTKKSNGHMGVMSFETFKRLVDELKGNVEAVTLASRGEPLLAPDLPKMLAYARGKFLALKVNTNASLLTEKTCHALLEAEPQTVVFSADAAVEPAYSQLRVGGKLDKVLANVRLFHDVRDKHYSKSQTITRVSGVKVPGSGELDDMEKVWGGYVDQVAFVDYNPWENTYERPESGVTAPCSDLWRRAFVWWDGLVNPCDVDFKSHLAVGNALESGVGPLWRSAKYQALREAHESGRRKDCGPCNRCTFI